MSLAQAKPDARLRKLSIKKISKNLRVNIILNSERLNAFPQNSEQDKDNYSHQNIQFKTFVFEIVDVLVIAIKAKKKEKAKKMEKNK